MYRPKFLEDRKTWEEIILFCRNLGPTKALDFLRSGVLESGEKVKEEHKNGAVNLESSSNRITCLDDLIRHCKIDLTKYEIESHTVNKWEVGAKVHGVILETPLFQIKARVVPKKINIESVLDRIENNISKNLSSLNTKINYPKNKKGEFLLEPFITDLHIGKICFDSNGEIIYDKNKAINAYNNIIDDILSRVDVERIDRIVLPVGNDLINIDNQGNTTYAGTPQLTGNLFETLISDAELMLIQVIDKLKQVAPVDVICIPGNHDQQSIYHVGRTIWGYYKNDGRVTVINNHELRKYYSYKDIMIGFAHGHGLKVADMASIASAEASELWGRSKYREYHLGHFHHANTRKKLINFQEELRLKGMTVRLCPTVCPADRWHSGKGYVDDDNKSSCFVFSENNLEQIIYTNFDF